VTLTTDASGLGWGATWYGLVPARGCHRLSRRHLHINLLELGAVRLGLLSFVDWSRQPDTVVRLRTVSLVTLHVITTGSSRPIALMEENRRLHAVCLSLGVTLWAEYIPSALNRWAYRLSRTRDWTAWTLRRDAFLKFERLYGPHTVDLFATAETKRCGRFFSRLATPGASAVDAMQHSWRDENSWANPQPQPGRARDSEAYPPAVGGHPRGSSLAGAAMVAVASVGLLGRALPAPKGRGVFARPAVGARTAAVVGHCGVPLRGRVCHPVPRETRWNELVDTLRSRRFGYCEGADTARRLVSAKYQSSTKRHYISLWERFVEICNRVGARAL